MNPRVSVQKHLYQALLDSDLSGGPFADSLAHVLLCHGAGRCLRVLVNGLGMSEEGALREINRTLRLDPLALCESPIEKAMMAELVFADWRPFATIPAAVHRPGVKKMTQGDLVIAPQFKLGDYRLDFLIIGYNDLGGSKWINVECDGDAYHNTTMAKWEGDRERDKCMRAWNIEVKRFPGRDIVKQPRECGEEVVTILTDWLGQPDIPMDEASRVASNIAKLPTYLAAQLVPD
jgi:very-short-patch-repair endonuclease